jgi:hypothetical protein
MCAALTELLLNSFYPQQSSSDVGFNHSEEQVRRCLTLIRENSAAAEVFYRELHRHVSVGSVVKLACMLFVLNDDGAGADMQKSVAPSRIKRGRNARVSMRFRPFLFGGVLITVYNCAHFNCIITVVLSLFLIWRCITG